MNFLISDETVNKLVRLVEDKPFKDVIGLLNEIKAVAVPTAEEKASMESEATIEAQPVEESGNAAESDSNNNIEEA